MAISFLYDRDSGDWLTIAIWDYETDPIYAEGGDTKQSGAPAADPGNSSEWGMNNQFREIAARLLELYEIENLSEKTTPIAADLVQIADSADGNNHKKVQLDNLHKALNGIVPAGGTTDQVLKKDSGSDYDYSWQDEEGGPVDAHDLGGSSHNADTLSNLNSKISDATLDDSSDPRDPNSHNISHQSGGGDAIKLDDLAAPDDNTDLDASTSKHGLLPKLGGGTTNFLRADGSWAAPAGGGGDKPVLPKLFNAHALLIEPGLRAYPVFEHATGTNARMGSWRLNTSTQEYVYQEFRAPHADDFDSGDNCTFFFKGLPDVWVTGKNIQLQLDVIVMADNTQWDVAPTSFTSLGDFVLNTVGQGYEDIFTYARTWLQLGVAAGNIFRVYVSRKAAAANELSGDWLFTAFGCDKGLT